MVYLQSPGASFNAGPIVRDILSLNPSSEVLFEVNAATNSLVAKVKITNTSTKIVVFKVSSSQNWLKFLNLCLPALSKSIIKNIKSWPKLYHYIDCAGCDSNGIFRLLLAVSQNLLSLKEKKDFS